jgi:hypothetical protein
VTLATGPLRRCTYGRNPKSDDRRLLLEREQCHSILTGSMRSQTTSLRLSIIATSKGWTDGLPVVPPVIDRVEATLAYEGRPPEAVIATHPATGLQLSVHSAAVNAVMAGCLPEYFPVLVAAFEAMDKPDFNFHGSAASTGGSAPLLIVSGPVADDIGMERGRELIRTGQPGQCDDRPSRAADSAQRVPDASRDFR